MVSISDSGNSLRIYQVAPIVSAIKSANVIASQFCRFIYLILHEIHDIVRFTVILRLIIAGNIKLLKLFFGFFAGANLKLQKLRINTARFG